MDSTPSNSQTLLSTPSRTWIENYFEGKPIFTTASETRATATTESFTPAETRNPIQFSPLAPPFQERGCNEYQHLVAEPQLAEPQLADTAPIPTEMEEFLMNMHLNGSEFFGDENQNVKNFCNGNNLPESAAFPNGSMWGEATSSTSSGSTSAASVGLFAGAEASNADMKDTFNFLVKSLIAANNYVASLTREQLSVLRALRPNILSAFLFDVAKIRSDKRMRRAQPNECAFCKNNGENEECYTSHALKDWRGRVLCPVLRAFRCPRCGATGDRAHTIKYCQENADGSERGSMRRRMPSSPALSPSEVLSNATLWSNFGLN